MANWIAVDPRELNRPIESSGPFGLDVQLFVSPYDVPAAIRGEYDTAEDKFCIQFKYLAPEEKITKQSGDNHVDFYVGKESNRLHKLAIDVKALNAETVQITILSAVEHAIDRFAGMPQRMQRRGNYLAAKRAIEQNASLLNTAVSGRSTPAWF